MGNYLKDYSGNLSKFDKIKDVPISQHGFSVADVIIGDNCWIGSDVIILKGVTIGDNVVIGAKCLIYKDIPSNSIVKIEQFPNDNRENRYFLNCCIILGVKIRCNSKVFKECIW